MMQAFSSRKMWGQGGKAKRGRERRYFLGHRGVRATGHLRAAFWDYIQPSVGKLGTQLLRDSVSPLTKMEIEI